MIIMFILILKRNNNGFINYCYSFGFVKLVLLINYLNNYIFFIICRDDRNDRYGPPTRTNYRLIVENLSSRVSWQVRNYFMAIYFMMS